MAGLWVWLMESDGLPLGFALTQESTRAPGLRKRGAGDVYVSEEALGSACGASMLYFPRRSTRCCPIPRRPLVQRARKPGKLVPLGDKAIRIAVSASDALAALAQIRCAKQGESEERTLRLLAQVSASNLEGSGCSKSRVA